MIFDIMDEVVELLKPDATCTLATTRSTKAVYVSVARKKAPTTCLPST